MGHPLRELAKTYVQAAMKSINLKQDKKHADNFVQYITLKLLQKIIKKYAHIQHTFSNHMLENVLKIKCPKHMFTKLCENILRTVDP